MTILVQAKGPVRLETVPWTGASASLLVGCLEH